MSGSICDNISRDFLTAISRRLSRTSMDRNVYNFVVFCITAEFWHLDKSLSRGTFLYTPICSSSGCREYEMGITDQIGGKLVVRFFPSVKW